MNRQQLYTLGAILFASLALSACVTPQIPANATAEQVKAAKDAALQADFDNMCRYGKPTWAVAKPFASVPALKAKIGAVGQLAVTSLDTLVNVTCNQPLDITKANDVINRGYDVAGQVAALVLQYLTTPAIQPPT
jgi:hypothetical protein